MPSTIDLVADSETEQEPVGIGLGHRLLRGRGRHGIARVDRGDTRRDHDASPPLQQERGRR